jgi:cellobiose transport system substrate-binding protein
MKFNLRSRRLATAAAVLAAVLVTGTACSDDGGGSGDDNANPGDITLTVDTFGNFGYEALFKQYEAAHPGVKIKPRNVVRLDDYTPRLQQWLAAGSGAGDVVALEEGILVQFKNQADKFVNLLDHDAGSLKSNFLDWKWELGMTSDGQKLIGLGTDIGPLGMCYRVDLFERAGLPTSRDEVSKLWPTWQDFIETGEKFNAANTGAKFMDGANAQFNTILIQEAGKADGYTYFDKSDKLVFESNPAIRTAFDTVIEMTQAGLSANLASFSPEWSAGFKQGSFATVSCPSWMLGIIEDNSGPENKAKWDVAAVPGGGGYWGGSWLAVPEQSKHKEQAADLAKFLTNPESQLAAYVAANTFPSSTKYYEDEAITSRTDEYFNDAPVGKIFGDGASQVKPVYLGPKNQNVRQEVENVLLAVGQGRLQPDEAWQRAIEVAKSAAR